MTEQIPQDLLAETIAFLAGCDDAGALRERLAAFVERPVDPLTLVLADVVDCIYLEGTAQKIRDGRSHYPHAIAILREFRDEAKPVPVDDAVVSRALSSGVTAVPVYRRSDSVAERLRAAGLMIVAAPVQA